MTVKPVYLEHVDNWFLKLDLYYFNGHVFKTSYLHVEAGFFTVID
jgi:hypothetical protein